MPQDCRPEPELRFWVRAGAGFRCHQDALVASMVSKHYVVSPSVLIYGSIWQQDLANFAQTFRVCITTGLPKDLRCDRQCRWLRWEQSVKPHNSSLISPIWILYTSRADQVISMVPVGPLNERLFSINHNSDSQLQMLISRNTSTKMRISCQRDTIA